MVMFMFMFYFANFICMMLANCDTRYIKFNIVISKSSENFGASPQKVKKVQTI